MNSVINNSSETQNKLFPVFLKLENLRVLIVGGGKVALEKVTAILNNSPATIIIVVAGHVNEEIRALQKTASDLTVHQRLFKPEDLNAIELLIVAINNKETSLEIKQLARQKNILVNVADTPDQCDFYLGSIVQKGNVKIAISTNGKSPTLAKRIRETFNESFPIEINESLDNLNRLRFYLKGDFTEKVKKLNKITSVLSKNPEKINKISKQRLWIYSLSIPALLLSGYLLGHFLPPGLLGGHAYRFARSVDSSIFIYILAGFTAQLIDGALGMAYGVTATIFFIVVWYWSCSIECQCTCLRSIY